MMDKWNASISGVSKLVCLLTVGALFVGCGEVRIPTGEGRQPIVIRRAGLPPPPPPPEPTIWWEGLTFDPSQDGRVALDVIEYQGWQTAHYLQLEDLLGKIPTYDLAEYERSDFAFLQQADLNGNGPQETFETGYFTDNNGSGGAFIAVRERGTIVKIFFRTDGQTFSSTGLTQNGILWTHCVNCSDFETIRWNGSDFTLN